MTDDSETSERATVSDPSTTNDEPTATDEPPVTDEPIPTADGGETPTDGSVTPSTATAPGSDPGASTAERVGRAVNYAALAGLCLLALVAGAGFYSGAMATISQWVATEYVSLFRTLFNLVVLLLAGLGVSFQLRRLR